MYCSFVIELTLRYFIMAVGGKERALGEGLETEVG